MQLDTAAQVHHPAEADGELVLHKSAPAPKNWNRKLFFGAEWHAFDRSDTACTISRQVWLLRKMKRCLQPWCTDLGRIKVAKDNVVP